MAQRTRLDFRFSHIKIDAASPVPKHRQVCAAVRRSILEGACVPATRFPRRVSWRVS